jgi:hypothetical protein
MNTLLVLDHDDRQPGSPHYPGMGNCRPSKAEAIRDNRTLLSETCSSAHEHTDVVTCSASTEGEVRRDWLAGTFDMGLGTFEGRASHPRGIPASSAQWASRARFEIDNLRIQLAPSHSFIPSPSRQPAELLLATLLSTHYYPVPPLCNL